MSIPVVKNSQTISRVLYLFEKVPVIHLIPMLPLGLSVLPSDSDEQPSNVGIRELAASKAYGSYIAARPVGSYPAFSPLPLRAVVFFYVTLPSQTAFC